MRYFLESPEITEEEYDALLNDDEKEGAAWIAEHGRAPICAGRKKIGAEPEF